MDWAKAKNIIIIALVFTNFFLLIVVSKEYFFEPQKDRKEILELFNQREIYFKTDFPDAPEKLPALELQYEKIEDKDDKAEILKSLNDLKISLKITGLKIDDKQVEAFCKNEYNNIEIANSNLLIKIKGEKIYDISGTLLKPLKVDRSAQKILPAKDAVIKLLALKDVEKPMIIEEITLVYWMDDKDNIMADNMMKDSIINDVIIDTALPAWQIKYNDGKIIYLPAFEEPQNYRAKL